MTLYRDCPTCNGTGETTGGNIFVDTCPDCAARGIMKIEAPDGTILRSLVELAVRVEQFKRAVCRSFGYERTPWMQRRVGEETP